MGASNAGMGVEKIAIFDQCFAFISETLQDRAIVTVECG